MPNFDISQENTKFGIRGQIRPAGIQKLQGYTFRRAIFGAQKSFRREIIRPAGISGKFQNPPGHTFRRDDFRAPEIVPPEHVAMRISKKLTRETETRKATRSGGRNLDPNAKF